MDVWYVDHASLALDCASWPAPSAWCCAAKASTTRPGVTMTEFRGPGPEAGALPARPLRVAHLTTVDMSLALLLGAQLDAVVAAGGEAIGISAPGRSSPAIERRGVRHVPLPRRHAAGARGPTSGRRVELWRVLRRERPTVLHTHNPKPGLYGRVVGRLAGVPIVVNTVHGLYATPDDPLLRRALVYALEAFASRWSDVELVQNIEDVELMRRRRLVGRAQAAPPRQRRRPPAVPPRRSAPTERPSCGRRGASTTTPWSSARSVGWSPRRATSSCSRRSPTSAPASASSSSAGRIRTGPTPSTRRCSSGPRPAVSCCSVIATTSTGCSAASTCSCWRRTGRASRGRRWRPPRSGLPIVATDVRGCRQVVDDGTTGLLVPVADVGALRAAIRDARRRRRTAGGRWARPGGPRPSASSTSARSCDG